MKFTRELIKAAHALARKAKTEGFDYRASFGLALRHLIKFGVTAMAEFTKEFEIEFLKAKGREWTNGKKGKKEVRRIYFPGVVNGYYDLKEDEFWCCQDAGDQAAINEVKGNLDRIKARAAALEVGKVYEGRYEYRGDGFFRYTRKGEVCEKRDFDLINII